MKQIRIAFFLFTSSGALQAQVINFEQTVHFIQQKFTYKFDDLNKIAPHGEFKLILRF